MIHEMALKYGHEVLRLPPYHCQYNPIELIWGIAKNYYDKHTSKTTDEASVLNLWKESLHQIKEETWRKSINHTEKIIAENYQTEQVIDEVRPLIVRPDHYSSSNESNYSDTDISSKSD